jgi:2-polyprenyl-6-hydroxyphenyl methylase/3-demethylubiquinone-9 3-methyltransferase
VNQEASFDKQVAEGARFEFGKNWSNFLRYLDESRIEESMKAVQATMRQESFGGQTVLDIGSGSGLSSLSFRRLGGTITSFDFDPSSVACTMELKRREGAPDSDWKVMRGSVLDENFMSGLGTFDVVYSWGVLHHTGQMWRAIANALLTVRPGGKFCLAIYNDQGRWSRWWLRTKKLYNWLPRGTRWLVSIPVLIQRWTPTILRDTLRGNPLKSWLAYGGNRGMRPWSDLVDWVGGLPFEVATPDAIFRFFSERGFQLIHLQTCGGGLGCNEFTFVKVK